MSMTLIQHIELGSNQASITFNSIPQTFTDLLVKISARSTSSGGGTVDIRLNINGGGAGNNLTNRVLFGTGSSALSVSNTTAEAGFANNAANTASTFASNDIYFANYRSSAAKSYSLESAQETNAVGASQMILAGLWNSTSAITSISFSMLASDLAAGTSATLYGITSGSSGGVTVS